MDSSKLKPFNLEQALSGAPVVTRDGIPVTQFHVFSLPSYSSLYGVMGTRILTWSLNGVYADDDVQTQFDIFMAPVKKTGWLYYRKVMDDAIDIIGYTTHLYASKEAVERVIGTDNRWIIQEIEWFE